MLFRHPDDAGRQVIPLAILKANLASQGGEPISDDIMDTFLNAIEEAGLVDDNTGEVGIDKLISFLNEPLKVSSSENTESSHA